MMVALAIVAVTVALVGYSAGTWIEWKRREITAGVARLFAVGLVGDSLGTLLMVSVSEGFVVDVHSVLGLLALFLMFVKTIWVTGVRFGKMTALPPRVFSVAVWGLWVAVYVAGFALHG